MMVASCRERGSVGQTRFSTSRVQGTGGAAAGAGTRTSLVTDRRRMPDSHQMDSQPKLLTLGLLALCVLTTCIGSVSSQTCDTGPASVGADGVGNDAAKALLPTPTAAQTCSTFMSIIGAASGYQRALGENALIRLAFECSGNAQLIESSQFEYDSDYEDDVQPAPSTGWNTLSGTFDGAVITSIDGIGTLTGAAPRGFDSCDHMIPAAERMRASVFASMCV